MIKSVGHNAQESQSYKANSSLLRYLEWRAWLTEWRTLTALNYGKAYRKAFKEMPECTMDEVHGLLVDQRVRDDPLAGLFISAMYNKYCGKVITLNDPILKNVEYLGYKCNHVIVNNCEIGVGFGAHASGVVVNNGRFSEHPFTDDVGDNISGVFINTGECNAIGCCSSGTVLNVGKISWMREDIGRIIIEKRAEGYVVKNGKLRKPVRRNKKLTEYLDQVVACAYDPVQFYEFSTHPAIAINAKIRELTR